MITKPNNWENVREFMDRPKLPVDGYICKIFQANVVDMDYGQQLCLLIDITEGQYAGFYKRDFDASTLADKKWKGVLRLWLPKNDGSEKDEWAKSGLKGFVTSVEKSNPGYIWNWDEKSLKGKTIGIIFRNEEWEYQGKHGWAVRPFRASSVDTIRNGDFTIPEDKPLKKEQSGFTDLGNGYGTGNPYAPQAEDEEGLPF